MMNDQSMMGQDPNQMQQQMQPDPSQQQMPPQQPDQMQQQPMVDPQEREEDNIDNLMDFALSEANIAKRLKNKKTKTGTLLLDELAENCMRGYEEDERSREGWLERNEQWLRLALLIREDRTFPWPNASNVKYPLLATAAMQFSARAYPALVPSDGKVVKAKVIPHDPDGSLNTKASNVANHMSYQVMYKMPGWEEDMDKLLMTVPISGVVFKKTYHNTITKTHHSHLVYPENLCVSYWAKNLDKAYRKTEILRYNNNEILEKVSNDEEFLDIEYGDAVVEDNNKAQSKEATGTIAPPPDNSTPHVFLAQHTFYDLDGDGYEEPYIITLHKKTKKVVRIIARWDMDGVHRDAKNKITKIEPVEYFTAFPFIPNPDGSIYALGFGLLLGPLNESVNSIINQLIDSGSLNNLQSGFIGKGLRIKMGVSTFQPGEWKVVNATGDDLRQSIFPLPTKEPSAVLMNLLQMLITSGNQLASIAEIFVGKMPGQNTPASTTQETVKQGMAVFTAIYKRIYRALDSEFKKIYRLNRIVPGMAEEEAKVLGIPSTQFDYDDDNLIIPGGDPTGDSESTKQMKIQSVGQMLQLQTIDPMAFTQWSLQSQEIPNYQMLLAKPQPPQPSPEEQKAQAEMQVMQQKAQLDAQSKQQDMQVKQQLAQLDMQLQVMKLENEKQKQAMEMQGKQMEMQMDMVKQVMDQKLETAKSQHDMMTSQLQNQLAIQHTAVSNAQKIQANDQQFKQKQQQMKQQERNKPKPKKGA